MSPTIVNVMSEGGVATESLAVKSSGGTTVERTGAEVRYTRHGHTLVINETGEQGADALQLNFDAMTATTGKAETLNPKKFNYLEKKNGPKRVVGERAHRESEAGANRPRKKRESGDLVRTTENSALLPGEVSCEVDEGGKLRIQSSDPKRVEARVMRDRVRLKTRQQNGNLVVNEWKPDRFDEVREALDEEIEAREAARKAKNAAKSAPTTPTSEQTAPSTLLPTPELQLKQPDASGAGPDTEPELKTETPSSSPLQEPESVTPASQPTGEATELPSDQQREEPKGAEEGMLAEELEEQPDGLTAAPNTESNPLEKARTEKMHKKGHRSVKKILFGIGGTALVTAGIVGALLLRGHGPSGKQMEQAKNPPPSGGGSSWVDTSKPVDPFVDHIIQPGESPWQQANTTVKEAEVLDPTLVGIDETSATEAVMQTDIELNQDLTKQLGFDYTKLQVGTDFRELTPQDVAFLLRLQTHRIRLPQDQQGNIADFINARKALLYLKADAANAMDTIGKDVQPGTEVYNNQANQDAADTIITCLRSATAMGILDPGTGTK